MEIQALRLAVSDMDLRTLAAELIPEPDGIEKMTYRVTAEGVRVGGEYATGFGFKVPFETLWALTPAGPCLRIQLAAIQVGGIPGGILRGALLRMIRDALAGHDGLRMEGEAIVVDVAAIACRNGLPLQIHLTQVQGTPGLLLLEAGRPD